VSETQADVQHNGRVMEWTQWPARDRQALSVSVAVFIIVISAVVVLSYESVWYGVMVLVALFAATAPYYLPTNYHIDKDGVRLRTPLTTTVRPWEAFAAHFADEAGVFLSPYSKLNWMAYRRGIYLRCPDNLAEVKAYVEQFVAPGKPRGG